MINDAKVQNVDCIVIGGVADGVLMQLVYGAERIELGHPTHAKPLTSPNADIEMAKDSDVYNIFYMQLPTSNGGLIPFAWAIVDGQSPAWAAKQLGVAYVQYSTNRMIQERGKLQ